MSSFLRLYLLDIAFERGYTSLCNSYEHDEEAINRVLMDIATDWKRK